MKKIFYAVLEGLLVLSFTACSSPSSESGMISTGSFQSSPPENGSQTEHTFVPENTENPINTDKKEDVKMKITVGDKIFTAALEDNSSADALKELLSNSPLTVDMHDYGSFEKVGSIGEVLPRNDEHITVTAGDIILYQGNKLVIYYDENTWSFTRIGRIDGVTQEELKEALGDGDVTVTFSLG